MHNKCQKNFFSIAGLNQRSCFSFTAFASPSAAPAAVAATHYNSPSPRVVSSPEDYQPPMVGFTAPSSKGGHLHPIPKNKQSASFKASAGQQSIHSKIGGSHNFHRVFPLPKLFLYLSTLHVNKIGLDLGTVDPVICKGVLFHWKLVAPGFTCPHTDIFTQMTKRLVTARSSPRYLAIVAHNLTSYVKEH